MATLLRLSALALLVGAVGYGGTRWYKLHHYPDWHETVQIGDDEAVVRQKMGSPDWIQRRPARLGCPEIDCQVEFLYGHSFPAEWYAVGLNGQGRVVWKYYLSSP